MLPSVCIYLNSVVFLVMVCDLAVSECTVTVHSFNSSAEDTVGRFRVLLTGCLIRCWLLKDKKQSQIQPNSGLSDYFNHHLNLKISEYQEQIILTVMCYLVSISQHQSRTANCVSVCGLQVGVPAHLISPIQ